MNTPKQIPSDLFLAAVESFLADCSPASKATHALLCKHCKGEIKTEPAAVALHETRMDRCVETGTVQFLRIPYCPRCEHLPNPEGCVHVQSPADFFEWCRLHRDVSDLILIADRRQGRRENGIARRKLRREYFEGDVAPETHHAFARPDLHEVLSEFGYWLNEFDGDFSTYVRRGASDYIVTHRADGSWRHVGSGGEEAEGQGGGQLRSHLRSMVADEGGSRGTRQSKTKA